MTIAGNQTDKPETEFGIFLAAGNLDVIYVERQN